MEHPSSLINPQSFLAETETGNAPRQYHEQLPVLGGFQSDNEPNPTPEAPEPHYESGVVGAVIDGRGSNAVGEPDSTQVTEDEYWALVDAAVAEGDEIYDATLKHHSGDRATKETYVRGGSAAEEPGDEDFTLLPTVMSDAQKRKRENILASDNDDTTAELALDDAGAIEAEKSVTTPLLEVERLQVARRLRRLLDIKPITTQAEPVRDTPDSAIVHRQIRQAPEGAFAVDPRDREMIAKLHATGVDDVQTPMVGALLEKPDEAETPRRRGGRVAAWLRGRL